MPTVPPRPTAAARLLLTCALALVGVACTTGPTDDAAFPTSPLPPTFEDGVPAPATPEDVVLTIDLGDETVDWDLATLASLEQHDLTIVEPFVDEEHTYTGPLWADVLRASGIDLEDADTVELVALDDFVAEIPVDPAALDGLLLAHEEDGEEIPVADGGPIRLVFPPDNRTGDNLNNWIWSIRTASLP